MYSNTSLLKVKDVAGILNISVSSAYRLMQTVIPTVRFGRTVRVKLEDLEQFIQISCIAGQEEMPFLDQNAPRFLSNIGNERRQVSQNDVVSFMNRGMNHD